MQLDKLCHQAIRFCSQLASGLKAECVCQVQVSRRSGHTWYEHQQTHLTLTVLQAASKTNDTAGDGTTTATILSAAIIAEGMKIVAAGTNPVQLTRGIEKTVTALVKELQGLSTDVSDADLANVATVSAGGDETVRILGSCPVMCLM